MAEGILKLKVKEDSLIIKSRKDFEFAAGQQDHLATIKECF